MRSLTTEPVWPLKGINEVAWGTKLLSLWRLLWSRPIVAVLSTTEQTAHPPVAM